LLSANPQPFCGTKDKNLPYRQDARRKIAAKPLAQRPKSVQEPPETDARGGRYCIPQCDRPNSWAFRSKNIRKNPACAEGTHLANRRPPPRTTPLPRRRLQPQPHPYQGQWTSRGNAPAARSLDWHWGVMCPNEPLRIIALNDRSAQRHTAKIASQPFRRGSLDCTTGIRRFPCSPRSTRHHPNWPRCCRRTVFRDETPRKTRSLRTRTKKYANAPATALPRHRPNSVDGRNHGGTRLLLRPHSQTSAFRGTTAIFHPCDQTRAPATRPAAEVLPALVMHFASWVTWLEGVIPRASDRMCGLPPAIVSAAGENAGIGHFGGQNTEATPYPSITAFHRCWARFRALGSIFGIVSQDTHRQGLTPLS